MPGPGKGYISKKDPRRPKWESLQGTSAGGSNAAASAAAYNPSYNPSTGTIASPSSSFIGPPAPTPQQRLNALRKKTGKSPAVTTQAKIRNLSVANSFPKFEVGKELGQLQKAMKKPGATTVRQDTRKNTTKKINKTFNQYAKEFNARNEYERNAFRAAFPKQKDRDLFVSELYEADWKEADKRSGLADGGITTGLRSPFEKLKNPSKRREQIRRLARNSSGSKIEMPSETQAQFDADQMVGKMIGLDLTPADIALMFATPLKAVKGLKAMKALTAAEKVADPTLTGAQAFSKATKTGKVVKKVKDVTKGQKYKNFRIGTGAAVGGAGIVEGATSGKTTDFVMGTAQGLVDDPGETLYTTGRGLISGIAAPFAIGGNLALTAKRGMNALGNDSDYQTSSDYILGPTKRMAEETLTEAKNMIDVYTSGDRDRIAKATQEDYGLLNAMGAYWLARPLTKAGTRAATTAAVNSKAGAAIKLPELSQWKASRKLGNRTVREAGRTAAEQNYIVGQTQKVTRANEKLNRTPGAREAQKKIDEFQRAEKSAVSDAAGERVKTIELQDMASWLGEKGIAPTKGALAKVKAVRKAVEPDSEDYRVATAILRAPELLDGSNRRLNKNFANVMDRQARLDRALESADIEQIKLAASSPEEADRILAERENVRKLETMISYEQLTGEEAPGRAALEKEIVLAQKRRKAEGLEQSAASRQRRLEQLNAKLKDKEGKLSVKEARERVRLQNEGRAIKAEVAKVSAESRQMEQETIRESAKLRIKELDAEAATLRAERDGGGVPEAVERVNAPRPIPDANQQQEAIPMRPEERETVDALMRGEVFAMESLEMDRLAKVAMRSIRKNTEGYTVKDLPIGSVWRDKEEVWFEGLNSSGFRDNIMWQKIADGNGDTFARKIDPDEGWELTERPMEFDTEDPFDFVPAEIGMSTGLKPTAANRAPDIDAPNSTAARRAELDAEAARIQEQWNAQPDKNSPEAMALSEDLAKISKKRRSLASIEQFEKGASRQKPGATRQEEIKARLAEIEEEKTAQRIERDNADRAFAREKKNIAAREREIKGLYVAPDPNLEPARATVEGLRRKRDKAANKLAAAIERSATYQREISDNLTPAEIKAAIRQADEELGVGPDYEKLDRFEELIAKKQKQIDKETDAAKGRKLTEELLNLKQQFKQEKGKGSVAGQPAVTKANSYKEKIALLDRQLDAMDRSLEVMKERKPGEQGYSPEEIENLEASRSDLLLQTAALRREYDAALMDNAAAMRGAKIRTAILAARQRKRQEKESVIEEELQAVFDEFYEQALEAGFVRAIYIRQKEVDEGIAPSGNPAFDPMLGTPREYMRSGALSRSGKTDRSYNAQLRTAQHVGERIAKTRMSQWHLANSTWRDPETPDQYSYTGPELERRREAGTFDPKGKLIVNERMFTDPSKIGPVYSRIDQGIDADNKGMKFVDDPDPATRMEQRLANEGEGSRYVVLDEKAMKVQARLEERINGVARALFILNRFNSRLVLATSPSWALAQPIAEFLILVADNPNPARLVRAFREVKRIHDGPDTAAKRGLARLAGTTLGITRDYRNAKSYQNEIHAAMKVARQGTTARLAKEAARGETLGRFDKWKGAWIREAGVLAELDRELSTFRQVAKAVDGNMDAITQASGILSKMTREEQVKWLNSKEGREAGERIYRNIDASLGNWTDLRPGTERGVGTVIFFYPFVRFSLQWTLNTFPKRHPVRWNLAQLFGQFQAETLERLMAYDPQWMTDWAVAAIYGSEDGPPTSFIPLNRYAPGGNAFLEAGFLEGELGFNLAKGFVPLLSMIPRIVVGGKDQYGNPIAGKDADFGFVTAGEKATAGQFMEELLMLPAPTREFLRETGYSPKEIATGEQERPGLTLDNFDPTNPLSLFTNKPGREPKAGDDPNLTRDRLRRSTFAFLPKPAQSYSQEQNVRKLFDEREKIKQTSNEYPTVKFRGREVSLSKAGETIASERKAWQNDPANLGISDKVYFDTRPINESRIMKEFIRVSGENIYAAAELKKINQEIVRYHNKIAKPLGEDSSIAKSVKNDYLDKREAVKRDWKELPSSAGVPFPGFDQARKDLQVANKADKNAGIAIGSNSGAPLSSGGYNYDATRPGYKPKTPIVTYKDQPANTPAAERIPAGAGIEPMKNVPRKRQVAFAKKIRAQRVKAFGSGKAKITAPGLSKSQRTFAEVLAKETGLDPRVVGGWVLAEQGYASGDYEARNYHNWLNIGPHMEAPEFSSPATAARATAAFLRGEKWGAGAGIPGILPNAVGKSPEEQVEVLRGSGWDAAGYQNGIPWQDVTASPINTGSRKKEIAKLRAMQERGKRMGVYKVPEKGANLAAVDLNNISGRDDSTITGTDTDVKRLVKHMARAVGESELNITSGMRPEDSDSQHSTGDAIDIEAYSVSDEQGRGNPQTHARGEKLAIAAVEAITGSRQEGVEFFGNGGGGIWSSPDGHQVIWNTYEGGDHHNHVHVSAPAPAPYARSRPMSPMQQVKAAERAKAAAASGTTGGGTTGGTTSGTTSSTTQPADTQSNAMENLQNFRNPDGSILNWGTGTEMDLPSAAVNVSEANQNNESDKVKSVAESFAGLPKYVKPKPKKR